MDVGRAEGKEGRELEGNRAILEILEILKLLEILEVLKVEQEYTFARGTVQYWCWRATSDGAMVHSHTLRRLSRYFTV
jgi:hypothetical protein